MALKLYEPGTRKGNRFFLVRGSVKGVLYEKSTGTTDPRLARSILRQCQAAAAAGPQPGDRVTFADAARRYVEFRNPSTDDRRRLARCEAYMGHRRIREILPADVQDAAQVLLPGALASTRNREVLRPIVTVIHHAAKAGLCDWIRVQSFREPRPRTRALSASAATALIRAARAGAQRRLLVWLFFQGTRISDTLRVQWADIDLDARLVRVHVHKTDRFETFPLHEAVLRELARVQTKAGPVFPWSNRSSLRRWLPSLCEKVGVEFTPHMARHTLGTMMAAEGASLRAIMGALGHADVKSSIRYQAADIEMVRAALPQGKKLGIAS